MITYLEVLARSFDFKGRSSRKEFWIFAFVNVAINVVLAGITPWSFIYSLCLILPILALTVRRLHDSGKSGWSILLGLIPFIGAILLLILMLTEGTSGPNEYGEALE